MSLSYKQQVIMDVLGLSNAELEALTTPDEGDKRLNKLYANAKKKLQSEADIRIAQSSTISLG